jgi:hypothetical protein
MVVIMPHVLAPLPPHIAHVTLELGEFAQEQHAFVGQADLAGARQRTISDRAAMGDGVKGRVPTSPCLSDDQPATELILVISIASPKPTDDRIVGNVCASMVLPDPGGSMRILIGPPGSGKTMLARRLPTILPPISFDEAIETTKIHSVAGLLSGKDGLIGTRPFRAPHHTISNAGLIGGVRCLVPARSASPTTGCCSWTNCPSFSVTCWMC